MKGQSGNPAGRPRGSKNKATLFMEALRDGEADGLTRKAVELAMAGNALALKLCFDCLYAPRRQRPTNFEMPAIDSATDLAAAMAAIAAATADGELSPSEALDLARFAESFLRVLDARLEEVARKNWAERPPPPKQSFREWMASRFPDGGKEVPGTKP